MSHPPSAQNVATTSSARPSSSAWLYAAMAARTPSATSASVVVIRSPSSEPEVCDRLVERIDVHLLERRQQPLVGKSREEAVDRALEVRDVALEPARQAHVLEALRVEPGLLTRDVREVLRG